MDQFRLVALNTAQKILVSNRAENYLTIEGLLAYQEGSGTISYSYSFGQSISTPPTFVFSSVWCALSTAQKTKLRTQIFPALSGTFVFHDRLKYYVCFTTSAHEAKNLAPLLTADASMRKPTDLFQTEINYYSYAITVHCFDSICLFSVSGI